MNIENLVSVSPSKRDITWEQNLMEAFPDSSLFMDQATPFQGPDGYSYVSVSSEAGDPLDIKDLLNWCYETGVGLVLNLKDKKSPDFVFTYGMIWNYILRGSFINPPAQTNEKQELTHIHEISEGYFPKAVRLNVKDFLSSNGFNNVKISLLSGGDGTSYQLIWYSEDFSKLEEKNSQSLLEAISWFLPLDYKMGLAIEEEEQFRFQEL